MEDGKKYVLEQFYKDEGKGVFKVAGLLYRGEVVRGGGVLRSSHDYSIYLSHDGLTYLGGDAIMYGEWVTLKTEEEFRATLPEAAKALDGIRAGAGENAVVEIYTWNEAEHKHESTLVPLRKYAEQMRRPQK